jgi:hypothetical protein
MEINLKHQKIYPENERRKEEGKIEKDEGRTSLFFRMREERKGENREQTSVAKMVCEEGDKVRMCEKGNRQNPS